MRPTADQASAPPRRGFLPRRPGGFVFSTGIKASLAVQWLCVLIVPLIGAGAAVASTLPPASLESPPAPGPGSPRFSGTPFIRSWSADDYGGAPVNWRVARHPRSGFVYLGNNFGVLEFDGASWRLLPLPSEGPARTIVITAQGEVWVGGYDEVCALRPNAQGELQAVNLLAALPPKDRSFGQLLHALATPDGVYLASAIRLLLFRPDGTAQSWPLNVRITGLWWQQGRLHASLGADGAAQLTPDGLQPISLPALTPPNSAHPAQANLRVLAARDEPDGSTLLLTSAGPVRWRGADTPLVSLPATDTDFFAANAATTATFLADGRLAFGFLNEGLALLAADGRLLTRIQRPHGLPSNRIEHIATDPEDGLWIAQRTGISRVQLDDSLATHQLAQGLNGSPRALCRFGGRLYIAHNEGAAWRDDLTGRISPLTGLNSGLNTFLPIGDRLFATGNALYEILPDHSVRTALAHQLTSLEPLPTHPGYFVGGSTSGLWLFQFIDGNWTQVGRITGVPEGISSIYADPAGAVWCVPYGGNGAWRLDFGPTPTVETRVTYFDTSHGLPPVRRRDEMRFSRLSGQLIATTGQWVRRFDEPTGRFVPVVTDTTPSGPLAITSSAAGDTWWFIGAPEAHLVRVTSFAQDRITTERVPGGPLSDLIANSIYHDDATDTIWIAGQGALLSADLRWRPVSTTPPLRVFIRRVSTANGEILYANSGLRAEAPSLPKLDHRKNALRFTFAAPTQLIDYRGRSGTLYRTRLDGLEATWTPWTPASTREFTNLPYRELVLHVQARDLSDRISPETTLTFSLLPPWWLNNWAVLGYAVTGALIFFGFVRLRTRALLRRAAELGAVVNERTAELAARNRELARLHKLELTEKTAARLGEEKAQLEMLRYQLNPHFLYNALGSIRSLIHTRPDEADEMTTQLADFCRMTLTRGEGEGGTLASELRMISSYLDMERTRWRELLRTRIDATPDTLTLRVPPFLLLPLVENAIKYGTRTSAETVEVVITVRRVAPNGVHLEVANTGQWVEPTGTRTPFSTGIGLENLRQRLQRYFPGAHEFTIQATGGWVRATVRITSTENFKPSVEHAQGPAY